MAKKNLVHKVTKTEQIKLTGVVSLDGTNINVDGVDRVISDFVKILGGKEIDITLNEKSEEEIEE